MANLDHLEIIQQGVDVWNSWRKDNPKVNPDLSGAVLSKQLLGGYGFAEMADYSNSNFEGANLSNATLWWANLVGANLKRAILKDAILEGADLSRADLRNADLVGSSIGRAKLSGANLSMVDLAGAHLSRTNLTGANLVGAHLENAQLQKARLMNANLEAASLEWANCERADFRGCNLVSTNFNRAILSDADLRDATLWFTTFGDVNLQKVIGLESVVHKGPSIIGFHTIVLSKGTIPTNFLRGCGLDDLSIEFAKLVCPGLDISEINDIVYSIHNMRCNRPIQFFSCFISYSTIDEIIAKKLHDDLQDKGVRCWFAPKDMRPGDRIRSRIDQEIKLKDKLLVILSKNSISSEWVGDEVEAALESEKERGRNILFPIRIDDAVTNCREGWAAKIRRRRHIGDFSRWKNDREYDKAFEKLVKDLMIPQKEMSN